MKPERMPWGVWEITGGALKNSGRVGEDVHRRQYIFYTVACMAKHGNRYAMAKVEAPASEDEWVVNADLAPRASAGLMSCDAFIVAGTSGLVSVHSFAKCYATFGTSELAASLDVAASKWSPFANAWDAHRRAFRKGRER